MTSPGHNELTLLVPKPKYSGSLNRYHGWWCQGCLWPQDISSYGIGYAHQMGLCFHREGCQLPYLTLTGQLWGTYCEFFVRKWIVSWRELTSDIIWLHRSCSTLLQIMACRLRAPSDYLNQFLLSLIRSSSITASIVYLKKFLLKTTFVVKPILLWYIVAQLLMVDGLPREMLVSREPIQDIQHS